MALEPKIIVETWVKSRRKVENTLNEGTRQTAQNALRTKQERQKLERQELERRRRKTK